MDNTNKMGKVRKKAIKPDNIKENIPYHMPRVPRWIGAGSGWGYTQNDALIMACKDSQKGIENEYVFVEQRSKIEVGKILDMGYESFELKMQRLVEKDGCHYDVLQFRVNFLTHDDWLFLKNDYKSHNNYVGDEAGLKKHLKLIKQRMKYYISECWINIDSFYGKRK